MGWWLERGDMNVNGNVVCIAACVYHERRIGSENGSRGYCYFDVLARCDLDCIGL